MKRLNHSVQQCSPLRRNTEQRYRAAMNPDKLTGPAPALCKICRHIAVFVSVGAARSMYLWAFQYYACITGITNKKRQGKVC